MTATVETLELGSRVYLATDPVKDEGKVIRIMGDRFFVKWLRPGRIWIYAATQLEHVV